MYFKLERLDNLILIWRSYAYGRKHVICYEYYQRRKFRVATRSTEYRNHAVINNSFNATKCRADIYIAGYEPTSRGSTSLTNSNLDPINSFFA